MALDRSIVAVAASALWELDSRIRRGLVIMQSVAHCKTYEALWVARVHAAYTMKSIIRA